ncbi:hypothetical protein ACF3NR_07245 [Vaginella massiliensis]|uniref:hypothetical protein n=1 Tax=Vaginella massiliensis TaxID=1816680 RepID=UPI00083974C6|nr:hypothetical protein [Vaginella massiliensis]
MPIDRLTKYLYFIFALLVFVSYIGNKVAQHSETYPFFWWQLFTNPARGSTPFVMHRVYALQNGDTIRLANDGVHLDQVVYNSLIKQTVAESQTNAQQATIILKKLGELKSAQSHQDFLLVEETYENPINITVNHHPYAKKVILSTAQ